MMLDFQQTKPPTIYGILKIEHDLAQTLFKKFDALSENGVVTLEISDTEQTTCETTMIEMPAAELSVDMTATLAKYFHAYAIDGTVTIEVTDRGLWLKNPNGTVQFLGSTRVLEERARVRH